MILCGIDEAGYGPTLGPLALAVARVEAADLACVTAGFARAQTGVRDSKALHRPGDLAPLERVALPAITWLTGTRPTTAAALFAVMGEEAHARAGCAWMEGADRLALPLAAALTPEWSIPEVTPRGVSGILVQPAAYNHALASGLNKADLELTCVSRLLSWTGHHPCQATVVDRLGGRRYYRDFLQRVWPDAMVLVEDESPSASRYRACSPEGEHTVAFLVDGESASPLTAVASCIAKYAREVHMQLFNRYWCARLPALRPTAGYPEDAKRWLAAVGEEITAPHAQTLIRGGVLAPSSPRPGVGTR